MRLPVPLLTISLAALSGGCSAFVPQPRECRSFPSFSTHEKKPFVPDSLPLASKSPFPVSSCAQLEMRDVTDARPIYGLGTGRISTLRVHRYVTGPRFILIDTGRGFRICENDPMQVTHSYPDTYEDWVSWDLAGDRRAPALPAAPPCPTPRPAPDVSAQPALTAFPIVEGDSCAPFGYPGQWEGSSACRLDGDTLTVPSFAGRPFHSGARVGGVLLYRRVQPEAALELRVCRLSNVANQVGTVDVALITMNLASLRESLGASILRLAPRPW